MKIVLAAINAKYIHSNLAVYSLKAYAQKYLKQDKTACRQIIEDKMAGGCEPENTSGKPCCPDIEIAEYTINHQKDDVLMDLYRKKPDVLAFSCYIWNIDYVKELTAELKKLLPEADIWLGGPEVSYDAEKVLEECSEITGVMCGEGEETFRELAEFYCSAGTDKRSGLRDIAGISWRDADRMICRNASRPLTDLNKIPFVYEDLSRFENRILYYETSRGCPFSCAYCLSSIDKKVRFRDFSLVREELDFFLEHKVPQVKFVDRTFNCNKKHAMEIWRHIAEHDNGVTNFHFEISADLLDEDALELFGTMRPGLIQLEIGVQSTNGDTIREIRRTMDLPRLRKMVAAVHAGKNIHQHLDLIAGLPYENMESFRRSYGDVYSMKPQQLQLGFLKVLKGSYMHEKASEYGICHKDHAPYEVLYTNWLSYEDVMRLKSVEEMTEVYYNSGQFANTMEHLAREYENPFDLYEELGLYYERNNLEKLSHARIRRYDILLDFLKEKFADSPERIDFYRELMIFDLYLRENMKSRPAWADDQSVHKEQCAAFFRKEEEQKRYLKGYEGFQARQLAKMTHVEFFHFPVNREMVSWKSCRGSYPVLFDYQNRDALTGNAAAYTLTPEDLQ